MPIIKKYTENKCKIAIWDINEPFKKLLSHTNNIDLSSFKTEKRIKESIVSRLLLKYLSPKKTITYNKYGAPEINGNQFISISHSKNLVAVILSNYRVGLDIEIISKKPLQLSSKFLSSDNQQSLTKEKATLIWCCKEAIYKWHQKGNIKFKNDIIIHPFILKDKGEIVTKFKNKKYTLHYKKIDNHFLVYVCN